MILNRVDSTVEEVTDLENYHVETVQLSSDDLNKKFCVLRQIMEMNMAFAYLMIVRAYRMGLFFS